MPKQPKDPNAPKRPLSAYFWWLKENRVRIAQPNMSATDVARQAGVEWKALQNKDRWINLAAEDKRRYEADMSNYNRHGRH